MINYLSHKWFSAGQRRRVREYLKPRVRADYECWQSLIYVATLMPVAETVAPDRYVMKQLMRCLCCTFGVWCSVDVLDTIRFLRHERDLEVQCSNQYVSRGSAQRFYQLRVFVT